MGRLLVVWMLGVGAPAAPPGDGAPERFQFTQTEMAVPVKLVFYAGDQKTATTAAQAAYARIHQLCDVLSDYDPQSELRRLTDATIEGKPTPVSDDLWRVLSHAQALAQQTDGAFDVTVGPVVRLWRRSRRQGQLPSAERLDAARALVGHRLLRLDPQRRTAEPLKAGMRLDLGGIAKGDAGDEALKVLDKFGITRALVDLGGDMVLGDPPPGKPGWRIGIARLPPRKVAFRSAKGRSFAERKTTVEADGPPSRILLLANVAVATSGDTWQYVEIDGRRYSHIVDPHTGIGLTDHSNVTVVAPTGIAADALASAVSVLGPERGLKLIEAIPDTAALILRAPQGEVKTHQSSGWKKLPTTPSKLEADM